MKNSLQSDKPTNAPIFQAIQRRPFTNKAKRKVYLVSKSKSIDCSGSVAAYLAFQSPFETSSSSTRAGMSK